MKAIIQDRYGGSDTFELRDVEAPAPGAAEVLVRVHAAALDRGTWHLMTGLPLAVRLGFGLRRPKTPTPGSDLAGTVEAVGNGVDHLAVGDEVVGIGRGSLAELTVARADKVVRRPAGLDVVDAAALPISGLTALQALRDVGHIRAGDRVLVIGASGGVGSYAVQLATHFGARVTAVASAAKADFVRSLGAEDVIDYRVTEITDEPALRGRFDVVVDIGGRRTVRRLRRLLRPTGTLVIVGGEGGGRLLGGVQRQILAGLVSLARRRRRAPFFFASENAEDIATLVDLAARAEIRPPVDQVFELPDARAAMDRLVSGQARGKVAVRV